MSWQSFLCLLIINTCFFSNQYILNANNRPPPRYEQENKQSKNEVDKDIQNTEVFEEINSTNNFNVNYQGYIEAAQLFENEIIVQGEDITVKVINYPIVDLLNDVCYQMGKKIVISNLIQEKVSIQADNISFEKLLSLISASTEVSWFAQGEVIIISNKNNLSEVGFIPIKYADLENIKQSLSVFGLSNKVVASSFPRGLLISASNDTQKQVTNIVSKLDVLAPSIKVEFQVLEINKSVEKTIGIAWQDGDVNYKYTSTIGAIKMLEPSGITKIFTTGIIGSAQKNISYGKILARPYIITTNGKEAHLSTGDEIPIFGKDYSGNPAVEYKRVGIELYATPYLLEGNLINIDAKTIVNIISGQVTQQGLTAPKISSREASTVMQVYSGETIVIGGLIKQEEINSVVKVPILGKIPILGSPFKRKQKSKTDSEILIFITPTLVIPEHVNPNDLINNKKE